jgi:hypothetical protein
MSGIQWDEWDGVAKQVGTATSRAVSFALRLTIG